MNKGQKGAPPKGTSGHSKLEIKKTENVSQIYSKNTGGYPKGVSGHSSLKQLSIHQVKKISK